jgi:hypothetical protein
MKDMKATMLAIMPKMMGSAANAPLTAASRMLVSDLSTDSNVIRTVVPRTNGAKLSHLRFLELDIVGLGETLLSLRIKEL